MTVWWLLFILGCLAVVLGGFAWIITTLTHLKLTQQQQQQVTQPTIDIKQAYADVVNGALAQVFDDAFREELRGQGRQRFEQIINENATFLKQDLDLNMSQLNEFMRAQITTKLDSEFPAYAAAMKQGQDTALAALHQTAQDIETQRTALSEALQTGAGEREAALLKLYEENMAKVVEHYVLQALGEQFDMRAQLPFIIKQMEANKQDIVEDMRL